MSTVVGIFDNARDLDKAIERLAREGFEDMVYDEGIVAGEFGNTGSSVFAPGSGPAVAWGGFEKPISPRKPLKPSQHAVVRAFKDHLADYHLPQNVIEAYATTFYHSGEFALVKTKPERAERVMEIMRLCDAARVNRHG